MNRSANILSVDVLDTLRAQVLEFKEQATNAILAADAEVRRSVDELKERFKYWTFAIRERQEDVSRARSALSFARSLHEGRDIGTSEQEIALKKAKARLQQAEEKLAAVRRWQAILPDILREYESRIKQMTGFLETEMPKAAVFLAGRSEALANYLATVLPPPEGRPGASAAAPASTPEVPPS
jgi:hypothetical protein